LFTQAFFIMFRGGAAVMWIAALALAVFEVIFGQLTALIGLTGVAGSLVTVLEGAVIGAFLTGVLITSVNAICEGQPKRIAQGFQAGAGPYIPLLLVGLILAVPSWVLSQLLGLIEAPLRQIDPANLNSAATNLGLLLCCLLPLILLVYLVVSFLLLALGVGAERGVVLESLGVGSAFRRAWGLVRSKLRDFLLIGLVMLVIIIVLLVLFGCPAVFFLAIASGGLKTASDIYTAVGPYTVVIGILVSVVTMPVTIYFSAVWTLAFRRWQGKEELAPVTFMTPPADLPPIGG